MDNDLRSTVVLPVALCIADLNAPLHRWWWHWILVLSRLQDIPSSDADVVEHCTHGNHLGCKSVLYFQDFEEDPSPQCLHHTKGPLNNDPGIDMVGIEAASALLSGFLYGVMRVMGALTGVIH